MSYINSKWQSMDLRFINNKKEAYKLDFSKQILVHSESK